MPQYKVVWVPVKMNFTDGEVQDVPLATETINRYARDGWRVVSVAPGTNAQTYHGLFVTFERD